MPVLDVSIDPGDSARKAAELKAQLSGVADAADRVGKSTERLRDAKGRFVAMGGGAKQAGDSIRSASDSLKKMGGSLDGLNNKLGSFASGLSQIKFLMGAYLSFKALSGVAESFIGTAATMESYQMRLRAVIKDQTAADATFERMKTWAAVNPINTDEAIGAFVMLKTAAVSNTEAAVKAVADLSTTMGRDAREVAQAIVSTESESLRKLGILLDQTGKKAVLTSGKVRLEVNKDTNSIREGIIELIERNFGGAMQSAANTYKGLMDTMGGMWQMFQSDVMGSAGSGGPFNAVRNLLIDIRDEWAAWTSTQDYKQFIQSVQGGVVGAVNAAKTALGYLASAAKWASDNTELLSAALKTLIAYKAALVALSMKGLILDITAWVSLAPAAISSMKEFTAWISLAGASIGPAGIVAAAVGAGMFLEAASQMEEAEKQAKITADAIEQVNNQFAKADAATLRREIQSVTSNLLALQGAAVQASSDLAQLATLRFAGAEGDGMGILGGKVGAATETIRNGLTGGGDSITTEVDRMKARLKALQDLQRVANSSAGSAGGTRSTGSSGSGKTKAGKSAAESLVEGIKDQMEYLYADGMKFVPVLDQWAAKLKPLTKDWKAIVGLQRSILSDASKRVGAETAAAIKINETATAYDDQVKAAKSVGTALERQKDLQESLAAYTTKQSWGNQQGLIPDTEYMQTLESEFASISETLSGKGLDMSKWESWSDRMRELFSEIQSVGGSAVAATLDALKTQLDSGTLSLIAYRDALRKLQTEYAQYPTLVKKLEDAIKGADSASRVATQSLQSMVSQAGQDLVTTISELPRSISEAFAGAIAYSNDLGESLQNIGEKLVYVAAKMAVLKTFESLFGGEGSWWSTFMSAISSVLSSADGNVFSGGRALAFAGGGVLSNSVVSSPTYFPMGKGKMGLMGEAGPEAVLPLSMTSKGLSVDVVGGGNLPLARGAGGRLGVAMPEDPLRTIRSALGNVFSGGNAIDVHPFASGGTVTAIPTVPAVSASAGSPTSVFSPVINVSVQSSGDSATDRASAEKQGKILSAAIEAKVTEAFYKLQRSNQRPGSRR